MPAHYLKLLRFLVPYAKLAGASPTGWASDVFDDITHGGSYVLFQPFPPNASGSRVGLVGSKFYLEGIRDRYREDVLFVSRVNRLSDNQGEGSPLRYDATFHCLLNGTAPPLRLDPVAPLLSNDIRIESEGNP